MTTSAALPEIDETVLATTRYLEALTVLDAAALAAPSVLPGWSRAHVVAHVSRNADAFSRVLGQAAAGEPASMYDAQGSRDHDIERTVEELDRDGLVADAHASARRLEEACRTCDADPGAPYTRLPDGEERFALRTVGPRRRAEVEIHHADLGAGYGPDDWPSDFSAAMVRQRVTELAASPGGPPPMVLRATDVEGRWRLGVEEGPEVRGTVGHLAWWLVGRGGGQGLTCGTGPLPEVGRWR
jgi:maleylpyruvate isomerase